MQLPRKQAPTWPNNNITLINKIYSYNNCSYKNEAVQELSAGLKARETVKVITHSKTTNQAPLEANRIIRIKSWQQVGSAR